jgi:uncharacterized membrane protein YphA (DoxX/SURF4 family)
MKNVSVPYYQSAGLLLLRVGAGVCIFSLFGLDKLKGAYLYFHGGQPWPFVGFNKSVGIYAPLLVACFQSLVESLGVALVAVGFFTRVAALSVAIGFAAATYFSHKLGEVSWILAAAYFLMFAAIALTGPGKFSLDHFWDSNAK